MRSWLARILVGVVALVGTVVVTAAPAAADDKTFAYANCRSLHFNTSFAYSYSGGVVYASGWYDYLNQKNMVYPVSPCRDINAEMSATGSFVVRTVVCSYQPGSS